MEVTSLSNKIQRAALWSTLTQVSIRLISPITNMILARLLAPEAFGVVATINMVISFVDMFTDAGFQKYLIQHEFNNEEERENSINVAFWTNLMVSIALWCTIILFRNSIAKLVGNPGLGNVLAIACIQLPITSFSSIQMALFRRDFNFKSLFYIQLLVASIPLFVTVPLAVLGFSYWSIIIGSICGLLCNAIILTLKSKWKPKFFYQFSILKEMLAFSIWSLFEAISIWMTSWIDTLIIGSSLSAYYIGLYKTSLSTVNALMMIVTASVNPILFSALSRAQNNEEVFSKMFYKVQKLVAYLVFPMGIGIFIYRDLVTAIMLGEQWKEASNIIGVWAITSAIRIVLTSIYSEVYRAKGKPKLSLFVQMIHLVFLIPVCLISLKKGFWTLVYARAFVRLEGVVTGLIIMHFVMNFKAKDIVKNINKPIFYTFIMGIFALGLKLVSDNIIWSFVSIFICILVYGVLMVRGARDDLNMVIDILKKR